jgi:DNA polymerase V
LKHAGDIGRQLWKPGHAYKKAGVMLSDISFGSVQGSLFNCRDEAHDARLMEVMDRINGTMGSGTMRPAATGLRRGGWGMRQEHRSPRYTTQWRELPRVR